MSAVQVPAREVQAGDRVLISSGCRSLVGDIGAVQQNGGVVYLWKAQDGGFTQRAADIVLNHGDPVTLLDLDTASSGSRQHYIDTGRYLRNGEAAAYSIHPEETP